MSTERTQEIEDLASEWLIRRDSGVWTAHDQVRLEEWLAASTLRRVAYLRLELAWEEAARLKALGAGIREDLPPPRRQWNLTPFFDAPDHADGVPDHEEASSSTAQVAELNAEPSSGVPDVGGVGGRAAKSRRRSQIGVFAVAASLLLVLGAGAYFWLVSGGEHYVTPVGGVVSFTLKDDSKVTLNTDTEIRVDLTARERDVDLKRGEAFFEVAKDPQRPFVVSAGGKRVIAVGTQFSVRRDAQDLEVVVTEGKVRVEDAGETLLTPGAIAHAGDAGVLVQRKTVPEAQEHLSWRTGVLMFRDQTLGEVVAEFNRYNERKIVIEDPKIADLRIEGNFRTTNVDAFVRLLESGFPVRARVEDDRVLLTSN
jgi:transmembrane sensor